MDVKELARLLMNARENQVPVPDSWKDDLTSEKAFEVQQELTKLMVKKGARVVGKKIGFTGKSMREAFNIPAPDYGNLFDTECYPLGTPIDRSKFIYLRLEGEIAFVLKKDLKGPSVTAADVIDATKGVMPSMELVASHYEGTGFSLNAGMADNGSGGGFVLGAKMLPLEGLDLRYVAMFMMKNGELVNSGAGVEVLNDPVNAVAFLANKMHARNGDYLKAGDIVLSGAITPAVPVEKGDSMTVCFSHFGNMEVRFV